jgi:hypothetical protein
MPERIQLSRRKGWRKPENTVVVARPSKWGNPFRVGDNGMTRAQAVAHYRHLFTRPGLAGEADRAIIRAELAGKNLACWCPLDQPCHADVLLELANEVV